jgi:phosphoribosyl 1,2-cyclic phosphate phosphodiesterase
VFVHGPDVLVDTPEEVKAQLNRSTITEISACFYSHWHPDHVMGRRVWEMNLDFRAWPRKSNPTDIYLPEQVGKDFRKMLGSWEHFEFLEKLGTARIVEMQDGACAEIQDARITPFRVAHDYVYAFLFEGENERLLIAPDELKGWMPPEFLHDLDLAVLPMGLRLEATFDDTMEIVAKLGAKRTILTHVEEIDGLTHDDLQTLGERLRGEGKSVEFAYDTLIVDV